MIRLLLDLVRRIIHTDFGNIEPTLSYHNLYITAPGIQRTRIFDLPFNLMVTCSRLGGWELWRHDTKLAGEYDGPLMWLVLDVSGHVIMDSRGRAAR